VRRFRDKDGEQIWFENGEIETAMEAELRKASMMCSVDAPVVELDGFIEGHLGASLDPYAELDARELGYTEFFEKHPPKVSINRTLTGSALDEDETPPGILGRYRATLAHEAAHVILHRRLFDAVAGNMSLFGEEDARQRLSRLQKCFKRNVSFGTVTDRREYQANQGMAALLMPRPVFLEVAHREIRRVMPGRDDVSVGEERNVIEPLSRLFQVSKQAARIRLETLGLVVAAGQGRLG